jgi:hypothetical protein
LQVRDDVPTFLEEERFGVLAVERSNVHGFDGEE